MEIIIIIAFVIGIIIAINEGRQEKQATRSFDQEFLRSCCVAHEISHIEYRAGGIVLARCIDGRLGIASQEGWMHLGQGKYIATKWKQHTGNWPYIHF